MAVNWTGHLTEPGGAFASAEEKPWQFCPQVSRLKRRVVKRESH